MAKRRKAVSPQTEFAVLAERISDLQKQVNTIKQTGPMSMQPDDFERTIAKAPWQAMLHHPNGGHQEAWTEDNHVYYHPGYEDQITGEQIPAGWKRIGGPVVEKYKVFADTRLVTAGVGKWYDMMTSDVDRCKLIRASAFLPFPGTGNTIIQVWHMLRNVYMLEEPIQIDSGDMTSYQSAFPSLPDYGPPVAIPNNKVFEGDPIRIDVLSAATGSKGLAVHLTFI